ncbi:HepT-like ribonuclease domain-containing protein [Curtanaerobium respiraculi]|uniref:HepT-like ribonuclease domain-containing protein n=1 Tax=Curtanaerobium respiraculi TaxID=2949669 RepID=UPI0024B323DB|nr:HepT-like ribonuclease domain-containing protein [Curtanaerobium respiraculi]
MKREERDREQLHTILRYCDRLDAARNTFEDGYREFCTNTPYQDSCSLCLIQIGEAVNRLSAAFRTEHPAIPWHRIYGMRNHLVHGYEMFDAEIVWDAIETCIPPLRAFCEEKTHRRI